MTVPHVTPEPPGPAWRAVLRLLGRLPQASLSRGMGQVADVPLPRRLRRPVLRAFAKAFGIDPSEAELPLEEYGSLNDFFVRRLRTGVRSWPETDDVLASPVDGTVGHAGVVQAGRIVQAKGRSYAVADLLGDAADAARHDGGLFLTLYLSPRHYHRVHAPASGEIRRARHVPGSLLPVNAAAVSHVEDLFPRNERVVLFLDGPPGRVSVVAVGAYNVGRISTAFDPDWAGGEGPSWVTNRKDEPPPERAYDPPVRVRMGDEIMAFHLGSTVVVLTEPGPWRLLPGVVPDAEVRLGGGLARRGG